MASFHGMRQAGNRPAVAGRLTRSFALRAPLALAGLAAAFVLASQLAGSGGTTAAPALPSFLAEALGAPETNAPPSARPLRASKFPSTGSACASAVRRPRSRSHPRTAAAAAGTASSTASPGQPLRPRDDHRRAREDRDHPTVERRQGVRTRRWSSRSTAGCTAGHTRRRGWSLPRRPRQSRGLPHSSRGDLRRRRPRRHARRPALDASP